MITKYNLEAEEAETCHCGGPIHVYDDGFTRGMCYDCSSVRCDISGMSCLFTKARLKEDIAMVDDEVNHPSHYTAYKGIEIIDLTEQMNFNRGNAIKYIARAGLKSKATELTDLKKAQFYINREIDRLERMGHGAVRAPEEGGGKIT